MRLPNAHRFDPATSIRLEPRGLRHAQPRAPPQRRLMARVASADHRTWQWRPNPCARCGPARRAPIESPPRSGIAPDAHEPPTPRAHARPRRSTARATYGDPVLTAERTGRPRRGVRGAAPRSEAAMILKATLKDLAGCQDVDKDRRHDLRTLAQRFHEV